MRMISLVLLLVGSLVAVGCQSTAPPGTEADPFAGPAYDRIIAQDGLNKFLRNGEPIVGRADSGALTVSIPVRIVRDRDVHAQYRFLFLDDAGRPLRPEMDWQYKVLPGLTQTFLQSASLNPDAVDWRLEIRSAR